MTAAAPPRRRTSRGAAGRGSSTQAPHGAPHAASVSPATRTPLRAPAEFGTPVPGRLRAPGSRPRRETAPGGSGGPPPDATVDGMTTPRARSSPLLLAAAPPVGPFAPCPTRSPLVRTVARRAARRPSPSRRPTSACWRWRTPSTGSATSPTAGLARRLGQETRAGAVLDIVCDRACTAVLCVGLLVARAGRAAGGHRVPAVVHGARHDAVAGVPVLAGAQPQLLRPGRPAGLAAQLVAARQGRQHRRRRRRARARVRTPSRWSSPLAVVAVKVWSAHRVVRPARRGGSGDRPAGAGARPGGAASASALLPLVNAEAYALVAAATHTSLAVAVARGGGAGRRPDHRQAGAVRGGPTRVGAVARAVPRHSEGGRAARWADRVRGLADPSAYRPADGAGRGLGRPAAAGRGQPRGRRGRPAPVGVRGRCAWSAGPPGSRSWPCRSPSPSDRVTSRRRSGPGLTWLGKPALGHG